MNNINKTDENCFLNDTPRHIAFIMDGNKRWAKKHGKSVHEGHKAGLATLEKILKMVEEIGIAFVTLYIFSTENWNRPKTEVTFLMKLIKEASYLWLKKASEFNYKIKLIGRTERLSSLAYLSLTKLCKASESNTGMNVVLALDYGGRDEIFRASQKFAKYCIKNHHTPDNSTYNLFSSFLDTKDIPDPDLLIRSGGYSRLSNFLLWQSAYTELIFIDEYWPEITKDHLVKAIDVYKNTKRNFGVR